MKPDVGKSAKYEKKLNPKHVRRIEAAEPLTRAPPKGGKKEKVRGKYGFSYLRQMWHGPDKGKHVRSIYPQWYETEEKRDQAVENFRKKRMFNREYFIGIQNETR